MNSADEEDDIYSDLPSFKYHESLEKLQAANKSLQSKVAELEDLVSKLTEENAELTKKYKALSTNASSVFKTAQAEVKRKDKRISELNKEIISLRTRGARIKQKRHLPGSFNDNSNSRSKKLKLDSKEKTKEPINKESVDPPADDLNNCNSTPASCKVKDEEVEAVPVPRAPNISCPTLYSQRMFKRIYNVEPVDKGVTDSETNEVLNDSPSSPNPYNESQSPVDSPVIKNNVAFLQKNVSNIDNSKTKIPDSCETNNNVKVLSNLNTEKEDSPEPRNLNIDSNTSKNNISKVSLTENVCSTVYEQVLHNPMNKVNTLISLVMNMTNETEHFKTFIHSERETKQSQISSCQDADPIKHNISANPMTKSTDKNAEHVMSEVMGLKLLNRPNKTTFCPISDQWSGMLQKKELAMEVKQQSPSSTSKDNNNDKLSMMEALFGSPLKWTENSTEDGKQTPKLIPPTTAYEDSCSAQIENSKFQKLHSVESVTNLKFLKESTPNKNDHPNIKCGNSTRTSVSLEKSSLYSGIEKLGELPNRPFEQINFSALVDYVSRVNENSNKPLTSASLDQTSHSTKFVKTSFTSPKYNDSVLGQFDDTTQLISALARDHSKISPIHTPIKENKVEAVKSPENKPTTKVESPPKINGSENPLSLFTHNAVTKKNEKKAILLEKPINILRPRKTPRIIHDKKTVASKPENSSSANGNNSEDSKETNKETKGVLNPSSHTIKNSNRIITPKIKVSSVSNEVIQRVRAIEMAENYRKNKYESSRHKCKNKEKIYNQHRVRDNSPKHVSEIGKEMVGIAGFNLKSVNEERTPNNYLNRPTSTKIEISPDKFRRDDRNRQTSNFKRPLSHYSRHRKNCRFRHSSVERKLIRDNRHSNRVRSTPVRVIRKHDRGDVYTNRDMRRSSTERSDQNSIHSYKSVTDMKFSKSPKHPESLDSRSKNCSNFVYSQDRKSPFSTPETSLQRNTHIKRSSRKIEWSATTSDVISTKSAEEASLTPKTESRMKWFLQPIDFNTSPCGSLKTTPSIYDKSNSENALSSEENNKSLNNTLNTSIGSNTTLEKTKSQNIVIISRKRPVKFGVNEISIQCSPKNQ